MKVWFVGLLKLTVRNSNVCHGNGMTRNSTYRKLWSLSTPRY